MIKDVDVTLDVTVRCPAKDGSDAEREEAEGFVLNTLDECGVEPDEDTIETDLLDEYFSVKLKAYSKGTIDVSPATWDHDSEVEYNFDVTEGDIERRFRKLGYRADAELDYEIA